MRRSGVRFPKAALCDVARHRRHLEPLTRLLSGFADASGLVIDGWVEDQLADDLAGRTLVDLLVDEVLERRCIALAAPEDGIEEPEVLRRVDGTSVYTVAGRRPLNLAAHPRRRTAPPHRRRTTRRISRRSPGDGAGPVGDGG
jgi:hypothetical protein